MTKNDKYLLLTKESLCYYCFFSQKFELFPEKLRSRAYVDLMFGSFIALHICELEPSMQQMKIYGKRKNIRSKSFMQKKKNKEK